MTNRRSSVARILVAVTTILALVLPLAVGAAGQAGDDFQPGQYWDVIRGPNWRTGGAVITQYTWDPYNTNILYATNGTEIQFSGNQGDSWGRAYVLPQLTDAAGFSADDSEIVDLQVDQSPSATDAYALVVQTVGNTSRPHVIASHDGGRVWVPADVGLPPTGRPVALRVAPNDPNQVYLAIALGDATADLIFRSTDSGATWTLRSDLSTTRPQESITSIEVDPQDSSKLWAAATTGVWHSSDAGASFTPEDFFAQETGPIDVYNGSGPVHVSVFVPGLSAWYQSNDTGGWGEQQMRGVGAAVESVAHGDTKDVLFVAAGGNAFLWNEPTLSWVDLDPPAAGLRGMVASRGLIKSFSAHTASSILIYDGPLTDLVTKVPPFLIDVPRITDGTDPVQFPPRLAPRERKVVLEPGERKTVKYTLKVPRTPLPLDVYLLLDTSASTTTFLENVARSVAEIANSLRERGLAVRLGLADYRAYPSRTPPKRACGPGERASMDDCESNYAYRQRLPLAYENGAALEAALEALMPDGGGAYRSMYAALYQSVSGAGQDLGLPNENPLDHDIPEHTQGIFTSESLRVILHATDESFPTNETAPAPGPGDLNSINRPDMTGFEEARDALLRYRVVQVGLSTGSESLEDLRKMASVTGALAPAGGVDCRGDGTIDIPAGDPLVCAVNPNVEARVSGLPDAIQQLLEATAPTDDVTFGTSGGERVVQKVSPDNYDNVIIQTAPTLDFTVTFSCPRLTATREYDVELKASLPDRKDPTALTTVVCRPPDPDEPPEVIPPLPPIPPAAATLVALAIPPPPPPPPPILEISSASQSQSQAQAQAGMVHQEQEQPQLASVTAFGDPEEGFAFSRYRETADPLVTPIRALGAGAVLMSFAFGFVMLSQELAREKVFNRRR